MRDEGSCFISSHLVYPIYQSIYLSRPLGSFSSFSSPPNLPTVDSLRRTGPYWEEREMKKKNECASMRARIHWGLFFSFSSFPFFTFTSLIVWWCVDGSEGKGEERKE